ncbi:MAG: hypothetical protein J6328_05470 [Bacilli bacterium]|nr:hypothetical protein [Bacilli bacterium]
MKSKYLMLTLSSMLLLSACNIGEIDKKSSSVGEASSSTAPINSSSAPVDSSALLNDLIANLGNKKHCMEIQINDNDPDLFTFVGDGGYMEEYKGNKEGRVKNSQGWFEYSVENGSLVLGELVTFNTEVSLYDSFGYSGLDFAALGANIYTVDPVNPRKFSSTNEDLLTLGAAAVMADGACSSVTLLINDDGTAIYGFNYGPYKIYYTFSSFGTATAPELDAFIASPKDKPAATSFDADALAKATENIMGEDISKLPFPSSASFAFTSSYDETVISFDFRDLKPAATLMGDYAAQLEANGWKYDAANSRPASSEAEQDLRFFKLPVTGNSDLDYQISLSYFSAESIKANSELAPYASAMPYGLFSAYVKKVPHGSSSGVAQFNLLLSTVMDYGENAFPTLPESDKATSFVGTNLTDPDDGELIGCLKLEAYFLTQEDAFEYGNAVLADLLGEGFDYDMDWWEGDEYPTTFEEALLDGETSSQVSLWKALNDDETIWWEWDFNIYQDDNRSEEEGQWKIWGSYRLYDESEEE